MLLTYRRFTVAALATLAATVAIPSASAGVISYDFTNASKAATVTDSNVTATDITTHSQWGVSANFNGSIYLTGSTSRTDEASALSTNQYFDLTITPAPGQPMTLSSFNFDNSIATTNATTTGSITYFLRSSVESPTFDITVPNSSNTLTIDGAGNAVNYISSGDIALGSAYQGLTSPVTFRVYGYATDYNVGDGNSSSTYLRIGTVSFNTADAPIPEPASLSLIGLGGLLLLRRIRRRA